MVTKHCPQKKNPHLCSRRPKEPPSVFKDIMPSCLQQNFIRKRPTSRSLSENRYEVIDELSIFEQQDEISSIGELKQRCGPSQS